MLGNNHYYHRSRFNRNDDGQSLSRLLHNCNRRPMRGGKHYPPPMNGNDSLPRFPLSGRQSWTKYTQIGSGK